MNYRIFNIGIGISFSIVLAAILAVAFFDYNPHYDDPKEEIDFSMHYARYERADSLAHIIASKTKTNIYDQEYWINVHFQIPKVRAYLVEPGYKSGGRYSGNRTRTKKKYIHRDDETIVNYFYQQTLSSEPVLRDDAYIALASCFLFLEIPDSAFYYLSQVKRHELPYYSVNKALYYDHKNQSDSAIYFFKQEIRQNGYNTVACRSLARHYIENGNHTALYQLIDDPKAKEALTFRQQQYVYFHRFDLVDYWFVIAKKTFLHWNIFSFIGAFLISFFWIFYLYKMDVYEPEKKRYVFLCFLLGCGSVGITELLSDMNIYWMKGNLSGESGKDFLYAVFGIGWIEEFSKSLPLLFMVYVLKQANEPYDYIKYACVSALGFAFVENILYIDNYGMGIIHGRMTLAAFGHLFFSSIIGYVLALNRYRWKRPWLLVFMGALFIAAFAHGFYDFWFINQSTNGFLSYAFIILAIFIFHGFINSALNNSDFYDREKKFQHVYYTTILIVGSSIVYAYEYMSSFLLYGFDYGLDNVYKMISITVSIYVSVFLVVLNRIIIVPKNWLNIFQLFRQPNNRLEAELRKGMVCQFKKFASNHYQQQMMPTTGTIVNSNEHKGRSFYLVQLPKAFAIDVPVKDHFVFCLKEKMDTGDDLIAFYLIPEEKLMEKKIFSGKQLKFCGWARLVIK